MNAGATTRRRSQAASGWIWPSLHLLLRQEQQRQQQVRGSFARYVCIIRWGLGSYFWTFPDMDFAIAIARDSNCRPTFPLYLNLLLRLVFSTPGQVCSLLVLNIVACFEPSFWGFRIAHLFLTREEKCLFCAYVFCIYVL